MFNGFFFASYSKQHNSRKNVLGTGGGRFLLRQAWIQKWCSVQAMYHKNNFVDLFIFYWFTENLQHCKKNCNHCEQRLHSTTKNPWFIQWVGQEEGNKEGIGEWSVDSSQYVFNTFSKITLGSSLTTCLLMICLLRAENRARTFFCTNFLNTPRGPGHPCEISGTSQVPPFETREKQTFEGGNEFFDHHPFSWKTPAWPGSLRTQKINTCVPFFCLVFMSLRLKPGWPLWKPRKTHPLIKTTPFGAQTSSTGPWACSWSLQLWSAAWGRSGPSASTPLGCPAASSSCQVEDGHVFHTHVSAWRHALQALPFWRKRISELHIPTSTVFESHI